MLYRIRYTVPMFDDGDVTDFEAELSELTAEQLEMAIRAHGAKLCGLTFGEVAPFEVPFFETDGTNATFVIRTTGLGPTRAHNTLGHGDAYEVLL